MRLFLFYVLLFTFAGTKINTLNQRNIKIGVMSCIRKVSYTVYVFNNIQSKHIINLIIS